MSINKLTKGNAGAGAVALPGLQLQTLRFALQPTTSTTFVAAGVLPARCLVLNAFIDMSSVASAATPLLDVGTDAATTGFLNGVSVGTTGLLAGSLAAGARTVGALLSVDSSGSGSFVATPAIIASATTVGYATRSVAARLSGEVVLLVAKL